MSKQQSQCPNGLGTNHRHAYTVTGAVLLAAVTALVSFGIQAQATLLTFDDKAAFLAATGASSATGPLPNVGGVSTNRTVGSATFINRTSGFFIGAVGVPQVPTGDWYAPLPGNDIAINQRENIDVAFASPVFSMGFDFAEPDVTMPVPYGNQGRPFGVDSTFMVTLIDGATPVDTFTFNAPDDVISFVGVWSDTAFDRAEIREIEGGIDDEYFGEFYTGTIPLSVFEPVALDIKPQNCPNPLNTKSKGVTPVAVLGTADLDVTQIDIASLRLEGVAAIRSAIEDVATPFTPTNGLVDALDCNDFGPDGFDDLTLKFDSQELIQALGDVEDGEVRVLTLIGVLLDGTPIEGHDVVVIKAKGGGNN
ncbi:MAG: hypothetical protein OES46_00145 [Gammaproteobacteria bacterium]|nr:hypothetical protein [Gammaproteobacteria bacterium]